MAGQPQIPNVIDFDVTRMAITREGDPPPAPAEQFVPSIDIVDLGDAFELTIQFRGDGFVWDWLKSLNASFNVEAHAEGYGNTAGEYNLGSTTGMLNPAQDIYNVRLNVPGNVIDKNGVYLLAAMVTFPPPLHGLLGFVEGHKMMVHEHEEA